MPAPKTVQLFLMDGTAQGRIKASLSNWTGVAYLLPRTTLNECTDRADLSQNGIYFLLGQDDDGNDTVYVGQARSRKNQNGLLGRIFEHRGDEPYWTHAIAITTTGDYFGPTDISYLENRFYLQAKTAGRAILTNKSEPATSNVTEEKQAELDEFQATAQLIIGSLGHRFLEKPSAEARLNESSTDADAGTDADAPLLFFSYAGATATGRQTPDGFVIYAGAKLRPETEFTRSAPVSARKARMRHQDSIDKTGTLTADVLFNSPTGAAGFLGGASLSGNDKWRTKENVPLGQLLI